jgi:hypothetical protein
VPAQPGKWEQLTTSSLRCAPEEELCQVITGTDNILFGMQNRTFGPCLAANNMNGHLRGGTNQVLCMQRSSAQARQSRFVGRTMFPAGSKMEGLAQLGQGIAFADDCQIA